MIKGIEMAVRDINAAGGVNGEALTLVGGDEGDDPSVAGVTVDDLLNSEKIDVLIGPASSTTALSVLGRTSRGAGCSRAHLRTPPSRSNSSLTTGTTCAPRRPTGCRVSRSRRSSPKVAIRRSR